MAGEVQQGIGRAAAVLTALGDAKSGALRASDIARAIGLGASTTARLLASLEELGYVRRERDTQLYAIGTAILSLGSQALNHNPVHRESRAAAEALAQRTGLSVNVGVLDGTSLVYLCHFEGALAPKSHTMVGMRQPLHASGLGKCLLLDLDEAGRRALLGDELERYTVHTLVDHAALTAALAESAERGYCTENQELALGRLSIAAPVRDADGRVVAGISVSGRLSVVRELDHEQLAEQLIETADRISVGLGMISAVPTAAR
ncbi:IclR family transcriptional regulator [Herbiconiux sp. VKM Ac-2851]|uniref:IclR family transcriptional regulator n=1 Tax=Herbiconiux sp. VKM Ac-2851 TaxID=2739025 RepID=UPI0015647386|nr:IclR family transcriptional regulator [Herbiconiux sp. VKM Ac-2851]NQX34920.1 IclR family transcriptional regulator [Herbiconiux sp. VKM Ac-2851]